MTTQKATLEWAGHSYDGRANKWKATCPHCLKTFVPLTTRMARQVLTCPQPKCSQDILLDYNERLDELNAQDKDQ